MFIFRDNPIVLNTPLDESQEESRILGAGQHTFPFQLQLPNDLPPSFEGAYGYIRYWAKATIDKPWKFDHHTKRAFTIIPNLDLNQEPGVSEPIQYRGELRTGCCCLPSGRFSGSITTNRKGFVPGSEISLCSQIENHSGSTCWAEVKLKMDKTWLRTQHFYAGIKLSEKLRQPSFKSSNCNVINHITYMAGGKFKQEKKVVSTVYKEHIPRGKTFTWNDKMRIPPLPPSHLKGCKLMKSQYLLQFRVGSDARCSWDEVDYEDEIIIGTLPLAAKITATRALTNYQTVNATSPPAEKDAESNGKPSYEECVLFGRVSIKDKDDTEHTLGQLIFTPLYAFYSPRSQLARASLGSCLE
ncbi:arrestin domain-containing protein 17-like [Physella acuta]|uniref:arrestin domain-containing protein 17-like n=1 Tax=Physella acuta TaxID=109671 RepID=UPI0027DCA16C|nr:arrestin domain-containing protein 17-like [Physella acuta]